LTRRRFIDFSADASRLHVYSRKNFYLKAAWQHAGQRMKNTQKENGNRRVYFDSARTFVNLFLIKNTIDEGQECPPAFLFS
jgi:hypothetical protein